MFKYLRVSVTDRCNYRCIYCMPPDGVSQKAHSDILRYEEILKVIKVAVKQGVEHVRITGGEPLVRKQIVEFVESVAAIKGLKDISMTTNGALLAKYATALKNAGLKRVNISVDSLNSENFKKITRNGKLEDVLNAIEASISAKLFPVKLNVVIIKGLNDHEIIDFADYAYANDVSIRFIEQMPFNEQQLNYVSQQHVIDQISSKYELIPSSKENTYGPSSTFLMKNGRGKIGFISSMTHPFCEECKRLRLTSDGFLLPCLDSDKSESIKGKSENDISGIIATLHKLKKSWNKDHACYGRTFDHSLSKIGG